MRILPILCAIFFAVLPLSAGSRTGADFLKIPVGARAIGLGQAHTASLEAMDALDWNVAGIHNPFARTQLGAVSMTHQEHLDEASFDHFGFLMPRAAASIGTVGVSLTRLGYPTQEGRSETRERTGSFDGSDLSLGFSFARTIHRYGVGTQVKYLRQELAGRVANGVAVDMGVLTHSSSRRWLYGLAVRNLGPSMQFVSENYDLPLTVAVGTTYKLFDPFTLSLDVQARPYQNQVSFAIGSELWATNAVALRAGYLNRLAEAVTNSQLTETNRGNFAGLSGISAGLAFRLGRFQMDYAMAPFGELGDTHTFTLSAGFGGGAPQAEIPAAVEEKQLLHFDEDPSESPNLLK